ncbi:hypothetical protein P8452_56627 [Trifolium repens]|nr:hypothetical protein P8452_56627 [Trifolium repens]
MFAEQLHQQHSSQHESCTRKTQLFFHTSSRTYSSCSLLSVDDKSTSPTSSLPSSLSLNSSSIPPPISPSLLLYSSLSNEPLLCSSSVSLIASFKKFTCVSQSYGQGRKVQ